MTAKAIKAKLLHPGVMLVCTRQDYRPELVGTVREVTRVTGSSFWYRLTEARPDFTRTEDHLPWRHVMPDGPDGFTLPIPSRPGKRIGFKVLPDPRGQCECCNLRHRPGEREWCEHWGRP